MLKTSYRVTTKNITWNSTIIAFENGGVSKRMVVIITNGVCYLLIKPTITNGVCYVPIIPTSELETALKMSLKSTT